MEIPTLIMHETAKLPLGRLLRDKAPLQREAEVNLISAPDGKTSTQCRQKLQSII